MPTLLLSLCLWFPQDAPELTVFVHATVVPMDAERVLADHSVVVHGDRIEALGPSDALAVPEGARVVDAGGRWLMPGLTDMHVHSWAESEQTLFLAHGVTSVRNMFGSELHLAWRAEIAAGARLGPTFVTAGPIVDGDPPVWPGSRVVASAEDGRAAVLEQVAAGYDFIKVYNRVPAEAYAAIVATAKERGIPVDGHVPDAVGLDGVLAAGQRTIEHCAGYELPLCADGAGIDGSSFASRLSAWEHVDDGKLATLVERTRQAGVFNCPTLVVMQKWMSKDESLEELKRPVMRYVGRQTLMSWGFMASRSAPLAPVARAGHAGRLRFVQALHEGGAGLLLGTDAGNPWVVAGASLHEELALLVQAGLSPYQALRAGTSEAARCLGRAHEFGTIAPGLRADLLLLSADPLADVGNAARIDGVMARGRWLPADELRTRLAALVAR